MKKSLFTLCFAVLCATGNTQPYIDSFDINTPGVYKSSNPANLFGYGNSLYFMATDSTHGAELWSMDANSTFPTRLTDIMPGTKNSLMYGLNTIGVLNSIIYYTANDSSHGAELWFYYPGGGTGMIKDIRDGVLGSFPNYLLPYDNRLYFAATDAHGNELWMHEPASGKTERLTDINIDSLSSYIREPIAFNGKIYFQAMTQASGPELYVYNPTDGSTQMVADIRPGNIGSNPLKFHVMGNKLYFIANDATTGYELYAYDGNSAPLRLTDLGSGPSPGIYQTANMEDLNGILYFCGYDSLGNGFQLFKYDPASNSTSLVHTINPSTSAYVNHITHYGNSIFFSANDATHGPELWKYDGVNTPSIVIDLYPGSTGSFINAITNCGLHLYFAARNVTYGLELFRYSNFPAGVENISRLSGAFVYPNPAKDIAHLEIDLKQNETLEILLTDMQGRTVYRSNKVLYSAAKHIIDIPVQNQPAGNYMYSLYSSINGSLVASGKLVKE